MERFHRVGVVGCGLMGSGIAEVCARADLDVRVVEADATALATGRSRVEGSLLRAARHGKLTEAQATDVVDRLTFTTDLGALRDSQLVIEAIAEDETAKSELFSALGKIVKLPDAVFATNTSSIPVMKIGMALGRAEQVIGVHFFNPVPVMPLVEVVPSLLTSETTQASTVDFVRRVLAKRVILSRDRAGFVVNSLLVPYLLAAIRMLESGFASAEDVDTGMRQGCAHPMGPLELADFIGLDTVKAIAESMYHEFKEPLYSPPPLLLRMVDAGLLGKKSGRGFYSYE